MSLIPLIVLQPPGQDCVIVYVDNNAVQNAHNGQDKEDGILMGQYKTVVTPVR